MAVVVIAVMLAVCAINALIAYNLKRSVWGVFLASVLFGVFGIGPVFMTIIVLCMGPKDEPNIIFSNKEM